MSEVIYDNARDGLINLMYQLQELNAQGKGGTDMAIQTMKHIDELMKAEKLKDLRRELHANKTQEGLI